MKPILPGLAILLGVLGVANDAGAMNPSLCLTEPTGCAFPGSTVDVSVHLGSSDKLIVGAQFKLEFDPQAFRVLEISPGTTCDPQSPFSLEIYKEIDDAAGTLFYAVGVNPFTGGEGAQGPAVLACIRFLPRGISQSDLCLMAGSDVRMSRLSDDTGHEVPIDNTSDCPTSAPAGALSCRNTVVEDQCKCDRLGEDCTTLNNACRSGVCNPDTLLCVVVPVNEGAACDDRNECTTIDRCIEGRCVGSGCSNPSLCLIPDVCTPPGGLMSVTVGLGHGDPVIIGAQFSVEWDPGGIELVSVAPGVACESSSPFSMEIRRIVDSAAGELFYAVGVALDEFGTSGPATLACLIFRIHDPDRSEICSIDEVNPFHAKLVDRTGQQVEFYNEDDCPSDREFPILNCVRFRRCKIPAMSDWGLAVLALTLLIGAKLAFARPAANS